MAKQQTMDEKQNMIVSNWNAFKDMAKEKWEKLTDSDFASIRENIGSLGSKIQELYGYTKDKAKEEIDQLFSKFGDTFKDATHSIADATHAISERVSKVVDAIKGDDSVSGSNNSSGSEKMIKNTSSNFNSDSNSRSKKDSELQKDQKEFRTAKQAA